MNCSPIGDEDGLLGYWNFNEGSGDTVYDISGNGNHGIINGGATFSEDVPGNSCNESDDDINNASYEIGDFVEGGIVFYVDETGERGLVAAMEDLPGTYEWGCYGQTVIGADLSFIGSGLVNSQDIINDCNGYYVDETAAEAALSYTYESYDDYYLPSLDELQSMYLNIGEIGGFTSDNQSLYWSSTENINQNLDAYYMIFDTGEIDAHGKWNIANVRPIRSFGNWTVGCIDETACNYNSEANMADGSCIFPELYYGYDCNGELIPTSGCLDSLAINYDELANTADGSCLYSADVYLDLLESNSNLEEELAIFETIEEEQDYSMNFDGLDDYIELNQFDNVFSNFSFSIFK